MLRRSYRRRLAALPTVEAQMASLGNLVRALEIVMLWMMVAMLAGGFVVYELLAARTVTRHENNTRFNVLECIALVNTPPGTAIHRELLGLKPDCAKVPAVRAQLPNATRTETVPARPRSRSRSTPAARPTSSTDKPGHRVPARPSGRGSVAHSASATPSATRRTTPRPPPPPVTTTPPVLCQLVPPLCGLPPLAHPWT